MFLTTFLYSQLFVTPPHPTEDFSGKTVIVTGSNTGLGLEAARHFARLNCAKLILAVRTVSKGQNAKESILASSGRQQDFIEIWELDLDSTSSVKAFADRAQGLNRLDAVVENAGVQNRQFRCVEGMEQTIHVNVIATFLLALLLLPKLRETAQKHGVKTNLEIVTSEVHHLTTVKEADEADLYAALSDDTGNFDGRVRYNISKALEVLFVRELVKNTGSSPIITLVNPGLCHTEFMRHITSSVENTFVWIFMALLARTAEVGSRTLVAGASASTNSHGCYMADSANQEVAAWVHTPRGIEVQKKVYDQTLAILESVVPGISKNI